MVHEPVDGGAQDADRDGSSQAGDAGGDGDGDHACTTPPCSEPLSCDELKPLERDDSLAAFPGFVAARAAWEAELDTQAKTVSKGPMPPMASESDPLTSQVWAEYTSALDSADSPSGILPIPPGNTVVAPGDDVRLRRAASLVLGKADAESLLHLTDFSSPEGHARIAAACEHYLASISEPEAEPLRQLCAGLGKVVPANQVVDFKVDGVKLFRADECALPSMAYGAFAGASHDQPANALAFTWPNYLSRDPKVWQPCVGAFVHARAKGDAGADLGDGWLMVKAVPDLAKVPFPVLEHDPVYGEVSGANGAPRGEFVATRQLFEGGASLYLGASPLWLLAGDDIASGDYDRIAGPLGARDAPPCDLTQAAPAVPCVLAPQAPFVFPSSSALWTRQVIDTTRPGHAFGEALRNPNEQYWSASGSGLFWAWFDALEYVNSLDLTDQTNLAARVEGLSAMFHGFRLYHGRDPELPRLRVEVVPLSNDYYLAVPDQGYVQLGTPTPAFLEELLALDVAKAFDAAKPVCEKEPFAVYDLE